jgi:hypothetical protein
MSVFPTCIHCSSTLVPIISDAAICVSVDGQTPFTIPRSQEAQAVRFLWQMRPNTVVGDDVYQALGKCRQVSRVFARLRRKWKIPVERDDVPKGTKSGTYGRYYLGHNVQVWEPVADEVGDRP